MFLRLLFIILARKINEFTVANTWKVIAVGLNYKDHAAESGVPLPETPVLFTKFTTSLIPNGGEIIRPKGVTQLDWEAEFAVVIGKRASRVSEADALQYVSGYTCMNDVTDREAQSKDGQWVRSKSYDTFGPIGPVVIPASDIQIHTFEN
ncbi:MAG: fumarylacetoacetate hydrolase family protein [Actinomycetota bacterium]